MDRAARHNSTQGALRSVIMPVCASVSSALAYAGSSASLTPAATHAALPDGCSASGRTTATGLRLFKKGQAPRAKVVRQRAGGLRAQRHLLVQRPWACKVDGHGVT